MLNLLSATMNAHGEEDKAAERDGTGGEGTSHRSLGAKKKNGIFYTPDRATRILTEWAIRSQDDTVLEPSFGGCGFLEAARDRLISLRSGLPEQNLYGCDIDNKAFDYLARLLPRRSAGAHFKRADFLTLQPADFGQDGFSVVVGNPPYVSLHNMSVEQRAAALEVAEAVGAPISRKASLWAYFILHSLMFLRQGGRMAWVLPGSFLHADYSELLRERLAGIFRRSLAVQLEERIFLTEGTEESSVILLCEGYQEGSTAAITLTRAPDLSALDHAIRSWSAGQMIGVAWENRSQQDLLPPHVQRVWQDVTTREGVARLGDYLIMRIGIVTGANKFFILSQGNALQQQIPHKALRPIIARFAHCRGLRVTAPDLAQLRAADARCLLLSTENNRDQIPEVSHYLNSFPQLDRQENATFQKRRTWHQPDDGLLPDAFFSAMQAEGPSLVLNGAGTTCTNTVYRVFFRPKTLDVDQSLIAILLHSTASQLSAELEGRSYGSGGLKLEPSEAQRICIWLPREVAPGNVRAKFERVDAFLRVGDRASAMREADRLLISTGLMHSTEVQVLQSALKELRRSRRGSKRAK